MVSVDSRNQFVADLRSASPNCYAFIFRGHCEESANSSVGDRAAQAIATNNDDAFEKIVEELSRRKIKPTADWILDDYLLFALLIGSKKFHCGGELCEAIIQTRRPSNPTDIAFHGVVRSLSQDAYAIEGEYSFVKLVCCDLLGKLQLNTSSARTVYSELTKPELFAQLSGFPKLLAYRSFDLLVQHGIEDQLDSMDAIVSAIESRSAEMSVRDVLKIAASMRPSALFWIGTGLVTLCSICFSSGLMWQWSSEDHPLEPAQDTTQTNLPPAITSDDSNPP